MPGGPDYFPSKPLRPSLRRDTPIEDLDLSVRAFGRISKLGVRTLHELALVDPMTLLRVPGFGKKSLTQVASILEDYFRALGSSELLVYSDSLPRWLAFFSNPESSWGTLGGDEAWARLGDARWRIENVPLSPRALDCLGRAGIKDLRGLAVRFPTEIRSFSYFGDKVLIELAHYLELYFDSLGAVTRSLYASTYDAWLRYARKPLVRDSPKPAPPGGAGEHTPSLPDLIKHFLAQQGSKKADIVVRRFGLAPGARAQTLAAVGRDFGLTRERIRQIASKAQGKFARLVRRTRPDLIHGLDEFLGRAKIATISEISNEISGFACQGEFADDACLRLLLQEYSPGVHPVDPGAQLWTPYDTITPDFYTKVVTTATKVLGGIPVSLDGLALETARRMRRFDDSDIESIQKIIRATRAVFSVELSGHMLVVVPVRQEPGDRRKAFAYDYIKEQGVPIHISEIIEAMQEVQPALTPESATPRSAVSSLRSLLERDEKFAWAGLSTFGLREWGYEPGVTSIGGAAFQLLRTAGKPLTTSELGHALSQLYRINVNSISVALNAEKGKRVGKDSEGRWVALR